MLTSIQKEMQHFFPAKFGVRQQIHQQLSPPAESQSIDSSSVFEPLQ